MSKLYSVQNTCQTSPCNLKRNWRQYQSGQRDYHSAREFSNATGDIKQWHKGSLGECKNVKNRLLADSRTKDVWEDSLVKEFQDSTDQLEADLYECSTVEITIEEHMKTDSRKSQKQNSRGNFQKYVQNVNELNEAVVGTRAIPRQVTDCYVKKQGEKNGRKVNFTQGYLPNCQQLYYAVEESLFFFHVQDMLSGTEELGGHPVRLEEPILYFIQEVQIKQKFIGPDIQTVLVFAQPWKIEIYSYVTNQINPRSILLSSLCSVWLPCQRPSKFQSLDGVLYYSDERGKVNYISTQEQKIFFFFHTGQIIPVNRQSGTSLRRFYQNNAKIFSRSLSYFFSSLANIGASLFFNESQSSLISDVSRRKLFTLVTRQMNVPFRNSTQTITMYHLDPVQPAFEIEFDLREIHQRMSTEVDKQCSLIKAIFALKASYSESANLLIVLDSGCRLYLDVTQDRFTIIEKCYPPDTKQLISNLSVNKQVDQGGNTYKDVERMALLETQLRLRTLRDLTNNSQLVSIDVYNGQTIQIMSQSTRYVSFVTKERDQHEVVQEVKWHQDNIGANQHYVHAYGNLMTSAKAVVMALAEKQLQDNLQKQCDSKINIGGNQSKIPFSDLHELARQVMYLPQRYIYATDSSVKGVILLRPIDTIVSVIRLCDNKDTIRSLLRKIYANLDSKELVCMLLQIYSDKDGVYFQGGFIDRKIEQMLGKRNSKDRYQEYYENNTDVNKQFKTHYYQLSASKLSLILCLIYEIALDGSTVNEDETVADEVEENEKIFQKIIIERKPADILGQAFMLYCSRVFRIFWFKDINDFTLEFCRVLLEKVIDLEKLLKTLCNLRYNGVIEKINLSKPKDMKELQTLPTGSNRTEPSHGSKLHDSLFKFTRKVTQLLKMIQSINLLPSMAFGSALAQPCETFHENMFHYILRDYHSEVIDEMRSHFPLYMTNSFYRVCKLWNDVDLEHDENKVIQLCSNFGKVPDYFVAMLRNIRAMGEDYLHRIEVVGPKKSVLKRFIKKKILLPHNGSHLDQYFETIQSIKSSTTTLDQKKYLLEYARGRLDLHIKMASQTTSQHWKVQAKLQLDQLGDLLYVQSFLKQYYQDALRSNCQDKQNGLFQKLFKTNQETNYVEDQIDSLNTIIYDKQTLGKLIEIFNSAKLQIIFLAHFGSPNEYQLENLFIHLLTEAKKKYLHDYQKILQQQLADILTKTKQLLSTGLLLQSLRKVLLAEVETRRVLRLICEFREKTEFSTEELWLSCFIAEQGRRLDEILEFYLGSLKDQFSPTNPLDKQFEYLFSWLNCYLLLEGYPQCDRSQFLLLSNKQLSMIEQNECDTSVGLKKLLRELENESK